MIRSVEAFVVAVREDSSGWPVEQPRWFRGEPSCATPLIPTLYRSAAGMSCENQLLQTFRARASAFASEPLPDRKKLDEWLFLAQHVGLSTRLLDWSESALIGLYFSLLQKNPIVWMLNPLHLNYSALGCPADIDPNSLREFPLPWFKPEAPKRNIANENIRGAWENDRPGVNLPVAVLSSYVHGRLRSQKACFTVQGKKKEGLNTLVPGTILKRYTIDPECCLSITKDLAVLGVTESVAFPDLDGLARDLKHRFFEGAV